MLLCAHDFIGQFRRMHLYDSSIFRPDANQADSSRLIITRFVTQPIESAYARFVSDVSGSLCRQAAEVMSMGNYRETQGAQQYVNKSETVGNFLHNFIENTLIIPDRFVTARVNALTDLVNPL